MNLSIDAKMAALKIADDAEFLAGCYTQGGQSFEDVPDGYIIADMLVRQIRKCLTLIAREVKAARKAATA